MRTRARTRATNHSFPAASAASAFARLCSRRGTKAVPMPPLVTAAGTHDAPSHCPAAAEAPAAFPLIPVAAQQWQGVAGAQFDSYHDSSCASATSVPCLPPLSLALAGKA